jgi:hypothetical protein
MMDGNRGIIDELRELNKNVWLLGTWLAIATQLYARVHKLRQGSPTSVIRGSWLGW